MEIVTNKLNIIDDLELFKLNTDYLDKVKVKLIGESKTPLYIIDNFYQNPLQIRDFIYTLPFIKKRFNDNFPGLRMEMYLNILFEFYDLLGKLFKDYHVPLNITRTHQPSNSFNLMYSNVEKDKSQTIPHVDLGNYAGVVYFNGEDECKGGTSFYKHKSSNKEVIEDKKEIVNIIETIDYTKFPNKWITDSNDDWELLHLVPMKFNRAIFYPSSIFHSAYIKENDFTENYRTTQSIFF